LKESSVTNFGLLIAFLLPGLVALWGVSFLSETIRSWLGAPPADAPSVGGFLYVTLAAILAGLTVSTVRWLLVDTLHHFTGLARPTWDFSRLQENVAAYDMLIEIHYRYYQFYANMVVALAFAAIARHLAPAAGFQLDATDVAIAGLIAVFLAGSRDTLGKYYRRAAQLLARRPSRQTDPAEKRR
jgi:hypothetical protein